MIVHAIPDQAPPRLAGPTTDVGAAARHDGDDRFETHLARSEPQDARRPGPVESAGQEPEPTASESEAPTDDATPEAEAAQSGDADREGDGQPATDEVLQENVDPAAPQIVLAPPATNVDPAASATPADPVAGPPGLEQSAPPATVADQVESTIDRSVAFEHTSTGRPADGSVSNGSPATPQAPNGQVVIENPSSQADPNGSGRPHQPPQRASVEADVSTPAPVPQRATTAAALPLESETTIRPDQGAAGFEAAGADRPGQAAAAVTVTSETLPTVPAAPPTQGPTPAAAGAQTPPQAPAQESQSPVDEANVARVVRGIRSALNQQGGTVTLRLHPPDMGFVRIELEINQGAVRAEIASQNPAVRAMLTGQLGQLRAALESHGLNVDRLVTQPLPSSAESDAPQQQGHQSAADGRSRGSFDGDDGSPLQDDDGERPGEQDSASRFDQMLNAVA